MNQAIVFLSCCLLIGTLVNLSSADPLCTDESCMLFGGQCTTLSQCDKAYVMGNGDKLCSKSGSVCCNKYKETCKSKGGECIPECKGNIPRADTEDCKSLQRECCIYV